VRQTDLDCVPSDAARGTIRRENITLLSYQPRQAV